MKLSRSLRIATEDDASERALPAAERLLGRRDRDARRLRGRKAVNACGDCGKGETAPISRNFDRAAIGGGEQFRLALRAPSPNRTNSVNHIARGQIEAWRDANVAGRASADHATGLRQSGACGAVNCAVDAAAARQSRIRGVNDRIDSQGGDVGDNDFQRVVSPTRIRPRPRSSAERPHRQAGRRVPPIGTSRA